MLSNILGHSTGDFRLQSEPLPPAMAIEAQRLNRRQLIADLLTKQGMQTLKAAESKGRFQAPIHWMEGVGQMGQSLAGAYLTYRNKKEAKELADRYREGEMTAQEKVRAAMDGTPEVPGTPDRTDIVSNRFNVGGVEDPSGAVMDTDTMEGWNASRQHVTKAVQDALDQTSKKVLWLQEKQSQDGLLSPEQQTFLEMNQTKSELPVNPIESISRDNDKALPMLASLGEGHAIEGMGGGVEAGMRYSLPVAPIQSEMAVPGTPGTPAMPAPKEQVIAALNEGLMSEYPSVRRWADTMSKQAQHQDDQALKEREHAARLDEVKALREQTFSFQMAGLEEKKAAREQQNLYYQDKLADNRTAQQDKADLNRKIAENTEAIKKAELEQKDMISKRDDETKRAIAKMGADARQEDKRAKRDEKAEGVFNADTARLQSSHASLDRMGDTVEKLLRHPGLRRITGIPGAFPNVPGGDAANAQALLDTLKNKVGFEVLHEMRENSKTGGALGQISDREEIMLQNAEQPLHKAQSYEAMVEALKEMKQYVMDSKERLRGAYNLKHGSKAPTETAKPSGLTPAEAKELEELKKKHRR